MGQLGTLGQQLTNPLPSQLPSLANLNALTSLAQLGINPQQELLNINQELLNRLQNMNMLTNSTNVMNNNPTQLPFSLFSGLGTAQPSAYGSQNSSNSSGLNNNNLQTSSSASGGTLTPSPISTLSRNPSPIDSGRNFDQDAAHFIRPLSQISTLTTLDADGKVKVIVPVNDERRMTTMSSGDLNANISTSSMRKQHTNSPKKTEKKVSIPGIVTTDERGVMRRNASTTSAPGGSATPSFIMRSSSEKVPSRSQMMSEVQRTQWARHTTK